MALTPFAPVGSLGLDTGRLFDDFFSGGGGMLSPWTGGGSLLGGGGRGGGLAGALRPLYTDVVERDKEYEMRVDVPGARHMRVRVRERARMCANNARNGHLRC
jgi:HSP20 family molecular chaperone IbpA